MFFPLVEICFSTFHSKTEELNTSPGPLGSMPPNAAADIRRLSFSPNESFLHTEAEPVSGSMQSPFHICILLFNLQAPLHTQSHLFSKNSPI